MNILNLIRNSVEVLIVILLICTNFRDVIDLIMDRYYVVRRKNKYRVKTTIIKDVIKETETERSKLRRLRVFENTHNLRIDIVPRIFNDRHDILGQAKVTDHFSIPGRTSITLRPDPSEPNLDYFEVNFESDEALSPYRDHALFLGYRLNENLDFLHNPPAFKAKQPVGTECFTYEAHFLSDRRLQVLPDTGIPKLRVYNLIELARIPIKVKNTDVIGGRRDFMDGFGETDWFRITIRKPPQNGDLVIEWYWL